MIDKKYITFKREVFFELVRPYINKESKVLDIGAGNATFSEYFKRKDFYLFDGNEITVECLKENYDNVFYGQLPELSFEKSFFDVIHCSHVIEHLTPNVFYETLKQIDKSLKKGGYLVVSAPLLWDGFYNDLSHIKPYPPSVFINYLCSKSGETRTRELISTTYHVVDLVYRYREVNILGNYINLKGSLAGFFLRVFRKLIGSANIKGLERTGYTIILKK